ncbi:MAG TPA: class I poly(R)-hydroxyalkanoic acid synthase [Burkholderiales bacterium]|nr:class I poly(R)-hydroxyalkanoic acid synthase [Burkholderiales bacterium]
MTEPAWHGLAEAHMAYQRDLAQLWLNIWSVKKPEETPPKTHEDRRFSATAWSDPYYDFLKRNYLLYERFVMETVEAARLDEREKTKLRFHARQFVHALNPANYLATNPVALQTAINTQGESLRKGMSNLLEDIQRGRIATNDEQAFEVGVNLAVSPGEVIYQNELMQLIQYSPTTDTVFERPLLIIPPCINKYYILDLSPQNSFVRYAVEQGHTVFMVSWRSIDESTGHLSWDDYVRDGVLKAIEVAREVRKAKEINTLGFCVGGTLLGAALGVLAKKGEAPIQSATLMAAMLDFSDTGEIGYFVDEGLVQHFEKEMGTGGVRSGRDLASTFAALRENDLIWPYVTHNYLLGMKPLAFDLLYWNGDGANLPGPWYCWYLRNTYLENKLREPDALSVCGESLDLSRIELPFYMVGTREDHIVPWTTAYKSNEFLRGERRFVLGAAGHIAGIINPPSQNKRSYWTNDRMPATAEEWFAGAMQHKGSWWPDWSAWLAPHGGERVAAPKRCGNKTYAPIEPAPGTYVKAVAS